MVQHQYISEAREVLASFRIAYPFIGISEDTVCRFLQENLRLRNMQEAVNRLRDYVLANGSEEEIEL